MLEITNIKEISLAEAENTVFLHKGEVYTYFDEGCTRFVYANQDRTKVIKIEKCPNFANQEEYEIYENSPEQDKMAETRLVGDFIEQEFVLPIKFGGRRLTLAQIAFANSCRNEVGWKGDKLVCFDLDEFKRY